MGSSSSRTIGASSSCRHGHIIISVIVVVADRSPHQFNQHKSPSATIDPRTGPKEAPINTHLDHDAKTHHHHHLVSHRFCWWRRPKHVGQTRSKTLDIALFFGGVTSAAAAVGGNGSSWA